MEFLALPLLPSDEMNPVWLAGVALSFFWWMQALGWSLPYFPARSLVLLLIGVVHLLVGLIPLSAFSLLLQTRGFILIVLHCFQLCPLLLQGLKWMRSGRWEGTLFPILHWRKFVPGFGAETKPEISICVSGRNSGWNGSGRGACCR